jgi:polysaccharide pyruvyl transferase WcaK-like protein
MRTAILTQPLHNNYGGLVQAYALQTILKRMGHDAWTVDLPFRDTALIYIKGCVIRIILKFIFRRDVPVIFPCRPGEREKIIISKYTKEFVREHIRTTECIPSVRHIKKLRKYNFEAFVVGSDQVWRPRYSPGISAYFLDFLGENSHVRRIAYAASFGVDHWEYNPALTRKCKKLAQKFDAVSVREDSAVELCRENFEVTAVRLLDPALLLERGDYEKLIRDRVPAKEKYLMHYMLDQSAEKDAIIDKVKNNLELKLLTVLPQKPFTRESRSTIEQCIYPPVTAWLEGFSGAEFVVTDSFHGTIFAIIFNRPFIAVGNKDRGLTRFTSLLKTLDLQSRLVSDISEVDQVLSMPVNFDRVNEILRKEKIRSMEFLKQNLSV